MFKFHFYVNESAFTMLKCTHAFNAFIKLLCSKQYTAVQCSYTNIINSINTSSAEYITMQAVSNNT